MSKLSIYETSWINLVFEGKNKEYGAYQLRQNSDKTTAQAFFVGLLFIATAIGIPVAINHFTHTNNAPLVIPDFTITPVQLTDFKPNKPKPIQHTAPIERKKTTEIDNSKQLKDPEITKPEDANPNIARNDQHPATPVIPDSGGMATNNGTTTTGSGTATTATPTDTGTSVNLTTSLDKLPEFPGGINKFYAYVGNNFSKPETDEVKTVRVYVSFVIEKDGSMTDIQVRRDPGYGLGKEAIRVLKSLKTKWEPGLIGGKPVRTAYNLPITVQMQ